MSTNLDNIKLTEGQVKELYAKAQETAKTAEQDKDTYSIYQLKHGDETRDLRFEPYDRLQVTGNVVDKANYELIYSAELTPGTSLEDILILSRLVDTFFSRISPTMQLPPKHHSIAYVLPWAEGLHWQSRSSGCSNS